MDVTQRLSQLEEAVADLQRKTGSGVDAAGELQTRVQDLETSVAIEQANRQGSLEAISAEFRENVGQLLLQVEQGLAAVEKAAAAQAEQNQAALQGLQKKVEESISSSFELGDAALEDLLQQAEKMAASAPMAPEVVESGVVTRQRSMSSTAQAYPFAAVAQAQQLGGISSTSSGPAQLQVSSPRPQGYTNRAVSPVPGSGGRTMVPVNSMPSLRPSVAGSNQGGAMSPGMPVVKATPRLQSRAGPQPAVQPGRCSSPGMTVANQDVMFCRGRSTEPQLPGRGDMTSRSPDQRVLSMRAPVVVGPNRTLPQANPPVVGVPRSPGPPMPGTTSPPVTHRGLLRAPFASLAPQSPRSSNAEQLWLRQTPAALRKPFPHR